MAAAAFFSFLSILPWILAKSAESEVANAPFLDDECTTGDDCSMNALQKRARKATTADEAEQDQEAATKRLQQEVFNLHWQQQQQERARLREAQRAASEPLGTAWDSGVMAMAKARPLNNSHEHATTGGWQIGGLIDGLRGDMQVKVMKSRDADWQMGSTVYQVFVDRFVPPKESQLEKKKAYLQLPRTLHAWNETVPPGEQEPTTKYYSHELAFYGGDLQGVLSKLDYVSSFGDILYLQPIFEAYSVHKYDTTDYFKIDPGYGTLEDFTELKDALHKRGMQLVLDGVFNHIGIRSHWFEEAMRNASSEQRNWFFIGPEYGSLGYKAWQGGGTLAELRLEDVELQKRIWNDTDSVVGTWLHNGADGWRLDVATEIGREYLEDLKKAAHHHQYGSLVVGEVSAYPRWWSEAMDGVLSFWMGWIIKSVVTGEMGGVFGGMQIQELIYKSSMEQMLRSWVVLSNHDLPRLTTVYPDIALRKFAVTLQFVVPGNPCIYYGEEIGMEGATDPYNRAPMEWEKVGQPDNEMYTHTISLVRMRRYHRALRVGDFFQLMSFGLLAFIRRTDRIDELVVVLANPTATEVNERVNIPVEDILEFTQFRDVLTGDTCRVHGATMQIAVPPHSARIMTMVHELGPNGDQYKRIWGHWETFDTVRPSFSLGNSIHATIKDSRGASHYDDELQELR